LLKGLPAPEPSFNDPMNNPYIPVEPMFLKELNNSVVLLNSLRLGVFIHNAALELKFYNETAGEIMGVSTPDFLNRTDPVLTMDFVHEDGTICAENYLPFNMVAKTGRPVENMILGVLKPQNTERIWVQVNAQPMMNECGELRAVITSFSDITAYKVAGDKLNSLYQHLEVRAFEMATAKADLEQFIYAATHDLQEPLRLIGSFLQLLKIKYDNQLDQQANEYIRYAVDGSNRMKRLILDLLEFSRVSGTGMAMVKADIRSIVEEARRSLTHELEKHNATILIKDMPVAYVCPALLAQLFENIIDNALKYRSITDPVIQISCEIEQGEWVFSIHDNGIGIASGYSEKIFDLFHQLHTNTHTEGTGAGLAICQKIVRLHRGRIWVSSAPGKGSTFYFTIPKEKASQ
jgi:signal transduction histidine kinase